MENKEINFKKTDLKIIHFLIEVYTQEHTQ